MGSDDTRIITQLDDDLIYLIWKHYYSRHIVNRVPTVGDWTLFPEWMFSNTDKHLLSSLFYYVNYFNAWDDVQQMQEKDTEKLRLSGMRDERIGHLHTEIVKISFVGWYAYYRQQMALTKQVTHAWEQTMRTVTFIVWTGIVALFFSC